MTAPIRPEEKSSINVILLFCRLESPTDLYMAMVRRFCM